MATTSSRTTRSTRLHPARVFGAAIVALTAVAAAVLAAVTPWALALSDRAGHAGEGAGTVAMATLCVLVLVAALAGWSLRRPGTGRPVRVAPLAGAAALFVGVLLAVVALVSATAAGDAGDATMALSASLWLSIAAGGVFGVASLPLAD